MNYELRIGAFAQRLVEKRLDTDNTKIKYLFYNKRHSKNMEKTLEFKSIRLKSLYLKIAIIVICITILPYILLAFFSVPSADDFALATMSLKKGIFGFIKSRYLGWSGRYSSDLIIALYNVIGHRLSQYFLIKFYYIIPLFLIGFCLITQVAGYQMMGAFHLSCAIAHDKLTVALCATVTSAELKV